MNIENFTISDHADNNNGKLSIMGMFDRIDSVSFPAQHAHCCLALRLRFQRSEEGVHKLRIMLVDADGKAQLPPFEPDINASIPEGFDTGTANLVLNINGLPVQRPGNLYWDLVLDGQLAARLPMYVRQVGRQLKAA